jgi:very-short-patch-repair endonuclease
MKSESSDPWTVLTEIRQSLPVAAVFACSTAAWLHGLGAPGIGPAVVMVPKTATIRSRVGLTVRRSDVPATERTSSKGFPVTSLHRTLRDLSLFCAPIDALIAVDMALQRKLTNKKTLLGDPVTARRRRGAARLRKLVQLAEPAESPMETRLRWLLLRARLPRPEVQTNLYDAEGDFVGRADLYYPQTRLVIEFDGGNHRERLVSDDRRQNLLVSAGFHVLRFTAADLQSRPEAVVALVESEVLHKRRS